MSEFKLVRRELLERLALPEQDSRGWTNWNTAQAYEAAKELRAVLAQEAGKVEVLYQAEYLGDGGG